jgi:hypothetical protein
MSDESVPFFLRSKKELIGMPMLVLDLSGIVRAVVPFTEPIFDVRTGSYVCLAERCHDGAMVRASLSDRAVGKKL